MIDYTKLQKDLLAFLESVEGQFVGYAETYAGAILKNLELGDRLGKTPEEATRIQLCYVFNNLEDVPRETLDQLNTLLIGYGFDMSDVIKEILEEDQGDAN